MTGLRRGLLPSVVAGIAFLCLMEITLRLVAVPDYILPKPSVVLRAFHLATDRIGYNLAVTGLEAIGGFVLGSSVGLGLGMLFVRFDALRAIGLPYVVGSNAVPIVAIAPLVVLWLGHGMISKVVLSAFLCFFPLAINSFRGFSEVPQHIEDLFRVYGATTGEFFWKARLPFAAPYLFSGARLNATYAVIGAIVAEFVGATSGLGFGMLQASYNLNIPLLWAYLVVAVALGMAFYGTVWLLERRMRSDRRAGEGTNS